MNLFGSVIEGVAHSTGEFLARLAFRHFDNSFGYPFSIALLLAIVLVLFGIIELPSVIVVLAPLGFLIGIVGEAFINPPADWHAHVASIILVGGSLFFYLARLFYRAKGEPDPTALFLAQHQAEQALQREAAFYQSLHRGDHCVVPWAASEAPAAASRDLLGVARSNGPPIVPKPNSFIARGGQIVGP